MSVLRDLRAERAEDADVLESVLDVVVSADDVSDALVYVVGILNIVTTPVLPSREVFSTL